MPADTAFDETLSILLALAIATTLGAWGNYGTNLWDTLYPQRKISPMNTKLLAAIALTVATILLYRYAKPQLND